jgi:hypothetical protein
MSREDRGNFEINSMTGGENLMKIQQLSPTIAFVYSFHVSRSTELIHIHEQLHKTTECQPTLLEQLWISFPTKLNLD